MEQKSSVNISYRLWTAQDIPSICSLLRETWLDAYSPFIPQEDILQYLDQQYQTETLQIIISDPRVVGFVAEVDGVLAAYEKTFFHQEEQRLYVHQLYVLPRFQSLGLGRRLMVFAGERALSLHQDQVWLGVMVQNDLAVRWYKKLGFEVVEQQPFTMGLTQVDHYIGFVPIAGLLDFKSKHTEEG
jgi:ribosomal protein S18 acetylase RimI-like enzyme